MALRSGLSRSNCEAEERPFCAIQEQTVVLKRSGISDIIAMLTGRRLRVSAQREYRTDRCRAERPRIIGKQV